MEGTPCGIYPLCSCSKCTTVVMICVFFQPGQVLSAFFYGYIITQIPGGLLAQRIGGRWVFGIGIVMTAVLTLLTQVAANFNIWVLVAVRALAGFFEVSCQLASLAGKLKWAVSEHAQ